MRSVRGGEEERERGTRRDEWDKSSEGSEDENRTSCEAYPGGEEEEEEDEEEGKEEDEKDEAEAEEERERSEKRRMRTIK